MHILKSLLSIAVTSLTLSVGANATYNNYNSYWDVEADAGSYGPIALGEDIELNACASKIKNVQYSYISYSICDVVDTSNLSVNWFAYNDTTNAFSWLTGNVNIYNPTYGNANTNNVLSIATGAGTFFNTVGSYTVGLYLAARNNTNLTINGFTANFGGDWTSSFSTAYYNNGTLNNGKDYASSFAIEEAEPVVSVPEPQSLLLLLPALALIAGRQRRRRKILVA